MSVLSMVDAAVGRQVPITRRSAIRTGGLAALAATVAGIAGPALPVAGVADSTPLPPAANDVPLIDRAEAMLVELQQIMLDIDSRNRTNIQVNLEHIARIGEVREDLIPQTLEDYPLMIGEGNRACDELDRLDAIEAEAIERIDAVYTNLPRVPDGAWWTATLEGHLATLAAIETDLIDRYGEDGRRAFQGGQIVSNARAEYARKARTAA
jgi:hypothetical protein